VIRGREEQGDGPGGSDSRKDPDQGPGEAADKAIKQVIGLHGDEQPAKKVIHRFASSIDPIAGSSRLRKMLKFPFSKKIRRHGEGRLPVNRL
jgi:hypothetical protein